MRIGPYLVALLLSSASWAQAIEYTEQRQPCAERDPLRRPFFGDVHVHTRYSLDASTQGTRTSPDQAYRFARGEALAIQPWTETGRGLRSLQLSEPLDFAMVSDHAELIGEVYMCNTPGVEGHDSWQCMLYRYWPRGAYYLFNFMASMRATHMGQCGDDAQLCLQAARSPWGEMREAAETHYDRSGDCEFTSFIGYEWTGLAPETGGNLHRNVLFRNADVPELPASFIDGPSAPQLWDALDAGCIDAAGDCDVLVIPHNSNLSAGQMFLNAYEGRQMSPAEAATRRRMEPIVEMMQHKGASECYFEAGVSVDELCAFEQLPVDNIAGYNNPPRPDTGFVRDALGKGLALDVLLGTNPFAFGFIASTDTHLGAPGAADEDRFLGHGGAGVPARDEIPPGLPDKLEYNPGGLAVVWAQENSRDALFDAMRRRETYGTSGPRIVSRFFGGWDFPQDLCYRADRIERAYAAGVPMGGEIVGGGRRGRPTFLVAASQDPGTPGAGGTPLQRLQIVKGRLNGKGVYMEEVYDVAGEPHNGASVDTATCKPRGEGFAQLCAVWVDRNFDPRERAYYYSRVVENPTCRWSQRICAAKGVDCQRPETIGEGLEPCCAPEHRPVVQERAWSSPIWYTP